MTTRIPVECHRSAPFRRVGYIGLVPEDNGLSVPTFAVPIRELTANVRVALEWQPLSSIT